MGAGFFITLEGVEGSGKTTQARLLTDNLRARGNSVLLTREPGGTATGAALRALLLDPAISLEPATELLLMLADRAQHVREQLRPALASGTIVISDRYCDSTTAYQGYGRGFDLELLSQLNNLASDSILPELTFVLDCPVEVGLARTRARQLNLDGGPDRFEQEQMEFHQRVRAGFLTIAQMEPFRMVLLDSNRPLEQVRDDILDTVMRRLEAR
jgi:dTMP kinase